MLHKVTSDYAPAWEKYRGKAKNFDNTKKKKKTDSSSGAGGGSSAGGSSTAAGGSDILAPLIKSGGSPSSRAARDSSAANKAAAELEAWKSARPEYGGAKYASEIEKRLGELSNRKFSYDAENDPVYRAYRDSYTDEARLAMRDAMGKAAALTGGMGNSYAQSAGQQAFGNTIEKTARIIPELYEAAWGRYTDEGKAASDRIKLMSELDDADFEKYNSMLKNYLTEGKILESNYRNLSKDDWDRFYDYAKLLISLSK